MTVFDMVEYLLDGCDVAIYDYATDKEVWFGDKSDIPDEYGELECCNMDPQIRRDGCEYAIVCLNVDTSE